MNRTLLTLTAALAAAASVACQKETITEERVRETVG